jgi:hypothetical protein
VDSNAPAPSSTSLGARKKLAFGLLLSSLSLAFAELTLSALDGKVYFNRGLRRGGIITPYDPSTSAELWSDEFLVRYETNSFGFRDRSRAEKPIAGQQRLALLGDSFGEGWGVGQELSFAALVDRALGPEAELWNTARAGGCQVQQVFQARDVMERFAPSWLIIQLFDNDLTDNDTIHPRFPLTPSGDLGPLPSAYRPKHGPRAALKRWWRRRRLKLGLQQLRYWLAGRTRFAHRFFVPGRRSAPPEPSTLAAKDRRASVDWSEVPCLEYHAAVEAKPSTSSFVRQRRLLDQIYREASAQGVSIALIYVPDRRVFRDPRLVADDGRQNRHLANLKSFSRATDTPLLDLQSELRAHHPDPEALYFVGDGHFNTLGHARVAELVAPWLEGLLGR